MLSLEIDCAEESVMTWKFKFTEFCFINYVEITQHFTGTRSDWQRWPTWSGFFHFTARKPGVTSAFCRQVQVTCKVLHKQGVNMQEDGDVQNRCVEHNAVVFPNIFTIFLLLCINSILFQSRLRYHSQFVHLVQITVLNKSVTQFEVLLYNNMETFSVV